MVIFEMYTKTHHLKKIFSGGGGGMPPNTPSKAHFQIDKKSFLSHPPPPRQVLGTPLIHVYTL